MQTNKQLVYDCPHLPMLVDSATQTCPSAAHMSDTETDWLFILMMLNQQQCVCNIREMCTTQIKQFTDLQ